MEHINPLLHQQFNKMQETGQLFRVSITGDQVWDTYLSNFTKENDPVFRDPNSSEHNCNYCHNFVRRYGNVVAIDSDFNIVSIWDIWPEATDEYKDSFKAMSELIHTGHVVGPFVESYDMVNKMGYPQKYKNLVQLGVHENVKRYTKEEAEKFGVVQPNEVRRFQHMHLALVPVYMTNQSVESVVGQAIGTHEVFERGMRELNVDTLDLIIDLINQDSLLDGKTFLKKVQDFRQTLVEFQSIPAEKQANWLWFKSRSLPLSVTKFRNELIGTLAVDLSQGMELNEACKTFNMRVDPANYMKAKAPITQRMIDEANKFIQENGYNESFHRRMAVMTDIKSCDILHLNADESKPKVVSVLDGVKPTATRHRKAEFDGVEEVPIDKFMSDILPRCTSVELFLVNSLKNNAVSLTVPEQAESKPIMKWPNNFSWTYAGNLAGVSQIRAEVKKAGGFVDAPFRFSIMWNEDGRDIVDLDAHCMEPGRREICFNTYKGRRSPNGGMLDVDMISPSTVGVENIFWDEKFQDGAYRFFIHNYNGGNFKYCKAEIFINGDLYQYYVGHHFTGSVDIATVHIKNGEVERIEQSRYLVNTDAVPGEVYGLETNKFHKVNLVCLSPNHWVEPGVGNKHYFFMLEGAKAPEDIRGFHNENLNNDLLQHRKVMEVLGNTLKVGSTDGQLSGVGFDATVRNEVVLRLKGSFNRVIKVKF